MFYDMFEKLLDEKGIKAAQVARDLGINPQTVSMWKKQGSIPNAPTLILLAEYFNTTPAYLMGNETARYPGVDTNNSFHGDMEHTEQLEDNLDDFKVALFGGAGEVTPEMWEEVMQFARFIKERERKKREVKAEQQENEKDPLG